jgi:hypothetical protein
VHTFTVTLNTVGSQGITVTDTVTSTITVKATVKVTSHDSPMENNGTDLRGVEVGTLFAESTDYQRRKQIP